MNWIKLVDKNQITNLQKDSESKPILIFKHSTRCSVSSMALGRLEREWNLSESDYPCYLLSVIDSRNVSQEIESIFQVRHESPQVLIIYKGDCIYHNSHIGIKFNEIKDRLGKAIAR